jgi:hypothetical protein
MMNFSRSSGIISNEIPKSENDLIHHIYRLLLWRNAFFLAFMEIATPCSSLPQTNKTSLPCNLKYRNKYPEARKHPPNGQCESVRSYTAMPL